MTRQLELLAPARNYDIGIAAIDCGADAVYIAGPAFGARQAASNSIEDIGRLCEYAHRFGARVFVTLNTILYENELAEAASLLHACRDAGTDAVIVQDLAIVEMARREGIGIPLHASTQCAIRTPEQARFYESLGFSRLVLERELSLDLIRQIRESVSCELECFVHGALCVCYSGQCYLSEFLTGRSANRGACIQACRSRYDLYDTDGHMIAKDKTLLSLKDLNLRDRMEDLAEAGVASFKIEGRLKNISYVKNTVRDYSSALDRITGNSGGRYCRASFGKVSGGFTPDTAKTFNRGYTDLYIDGRRGKWASLDSAKSMGERIGTVTFLSRQKDMLRISPEKTGRPLILNNGDGFTFVSGSEVIGFRGDICNGAEIRCKRIPELYVGAVLYRNFDNAFERELEKDMPVREIGVGITVTISGHISEHSGYSLDIAAVSEDGRKILLRTDAGATTAENPERMLQMMYAQLGKSSGIYRFSVSDIRFAADTGEGSRPDIPFMPASFLNGIRRELAERLDQYPCNRRPMLVRTLLTRLSEDRDRKVAHSGKETSYKDNVANQTAAAIYEDMGTRIAGMAYEIEHQPDAELMRTRYCVRYELGICPRQGGVRTAEPLRIVNNGRSLTLGFDCRHCEMTVTAASGK